MHGLCKANISILGISFRGGVDFFTGLWSLQGSFSVCCYNAASFLFQDVYAGAFCEVEEFCLGPHPEDDA